MIFNKQYFEQSTYWWLLKKVAYGVAYFMYFYFVCLGAHKMKAVALGNIVEASRVESGNRVRVRIARVTVKAGEEAWGTPEQDAKKYGDIATGTTNSWLKVFDKNDKRYDSIAKRYLLMLSVSARKGSCKNTAMLPCFGSTDIVGHIAPYLEKIEKGYIFPMAIDWKDWKHDSALSLIWTQHGIFYLPMPYCDIQDFHNFELLQFQKNIRETNCQVLLKNPTDKGPEKYIKINRLQDGVTTFVNIIEPNRTSNVHDPSNVFVVRGDCLPRKVYFFNCKLPSSPFLSKTFWDLRNEIFEKYPSISKKSRKQLVIGCTWCNKPYETWRYILATVRPCKHTGPKYCKGGTCFNEDVSLPLSHDSGHPQLPRFIMCTLKELDEWLKEKSNLKKRETHSPLAAPGERQAYIFDEMTFRSASTDLIADHFGLAPLFGTNSPGMIVGERFFMDKAPSVSKSHWSMDFWRYKSEYFSKNLE